VSRLANKEIRLQFSGYAIFAAKIVSVATGFIFQLMLARTLLSNPATSQQYSIYFNINDVAAYFTMAGGVLPFWIMRYYARNKEGAIKTGLAATAILSVIFATLYLGIISLILPIFTVPSVFLPIYLIAVFQIVELYFYGFYETCLQAYKPQAIGYGLLIQQVTKISVGYVLIVQLGQPLLGAVVATIVSFGIHLGYYTNLLKHEMKQRIQWSYVKEWLKGSVLTLYSVGGTQLVAFIFIMLFIFGSQDGRGIYGAAANISSIIGFSSFLSFALYAKLLTERKPEDITTSLKMVFMFALPMAAGAIALADSYILLLAGTESTSLYQQGYIVLIVLAIDALITVCGGILSSVVYGFESVDESGKMSMRQLFKSKLFLTYSLSYIQAAFALPITYIVLSTYASGQPLLAAFSVSLINTSVHFFTLAALYQIARKMTRIIIPWRSMVKYVFASAAMASVLFIMAPHPTDTLMTLVETALGGIVYLTILYLIDKEAREIPKAIIHWIKAFLNPKKQI
jgi:O-antigen/teichoic acid export membrane protein